jgi:hypothetical protein
MVIFIKVINKKLIMLYMLHRITYVWRNALRARARKTPVARLAGFVVFSRAHIQPH